MHEDGIKLLEKEAEIIIPKKPLNKLTTADLIDIGREAEAMIAVTATEKITRDVIENLPRVRIIARHGVGYDNVDVKAASEYGIYVTTAPVLDGTVADQAFALLLSLARNICKGHNYVMSKKWKVSDPFKFMGTDIWGKTAGIIGLGRIGTRIAERATGFKMKVQYYDIIRKTGLESKFGFQYKQFDELLKESDIIFIASPLSNDTRGIIGEREFSLMKHSALLINVARGPIIDHNAMIKALVEKRIAGAGLDVFYKEPLPVDDQLISLENVVLTPHLASNTIECRRRMAMTVAEEVLRVLHGEPPKYAVNEISNRRTL